MSATSWDGAVLRAAFEFAAASLIEHASEIDALNVYPVPDGDTGTNMSLTLSAAIEHVAKLPAEQPRASDIAAAIARGSLLGARGNSGVILSQIFRGFSDGVAGCLEISGDEMKRGLAQASATAYRAVISPVEGTMLTVIRVASEEAAATPADASLLDVIDAATQGAERALAKTPQQLDMLRQAGVVDAGGQGVVVLLAGLRSFARGDRQAEVEISHKLPDLAAIDVTQDDHDGFGYCTNFMIVGDDMPVDIARSELAAMGQSAVIVGDPTLIKVHIHTEHPGEILERALAWGSLSQVRIDHMDAQVAARTAQPVEERAGSFSIIAVANGSGVRDVFRSLGARTIVDGGKTMNPSIDQLLKAIESTASTEVILLPNNSNVILAARAAADLTGKQVRVVSTRSVAGGLAALNALDLDGSFADAERSIDRALKRLTTVEIARADRSATIDDIAVEPGNWIGFVNDRLVSSAHTIPNLVRSIAAHDALADCEVGTVVIGEDADTTLTEELSDSFSRWLPDIDLELLEGGQPHYAFVIGLE